MSRMQRALSLIGVAFFVAGIVVTVGVVDLPTLGVQSQSSDSLPTTVADDDASGSDGAVGTEDRPGASAGETSGDEDEREREREKREEQEEEDGKDEKKQEEKEKEDEKKDREEHEDGHGKDESGEDEDDGNRGLGNG